MATDPPVIDLGDRPAPPPEPEPEPRLDAARGDPWGRRADRRQAARRRHPRLRGARRRRLRQGRRDPRTGARQRATRRLEKIPGSAKDRRQAPHAGIPDCEALVAADFDKVVEILGRRSPSAPSPARSRSSQAPRSSRPRLDRRPSYCVALAASADLDPAREIPGSASGSRRSRTRIPDCERWSPPTSTSSRSSPELAARR